jgi:hypothetical protein
MLERLIRNTNQKLTKSYELVPVTMSYFIFASFQIKHRVIQSIKCLSQKVRERGRPGLSRPAPRYQVKEEASPQLAQPALAGANALVALLLSHALGNSSPERRGLSLLQLIFRLGRGANSHEMPPCAGVDPTSTLSSKSRRPEG